jgi:Holliday junction resolvase RusA-like endonuclease
LHIKDYAMPGSNDSKAQWSRLTFFVPGIPRGQARAQSRVLNKPNGDVVRSTNGRAIITHHKTEAQATDEARISAILTRYAPEWPIVGPIRLWVRAQLPVPASKSARWKRLALAGFISPDNKKPDWDNLGKHLGDCFKGVIWGDDVQVIRGTVEKCYSEKPGYFVVVEYIQELQPATSFEDESSGEA